MKDLASVLYSLSEDVDKEASAFQGVQKRSRGSQKKGKGKGKGKGKAQAQQAGGEGGKEEEEADDGLGLFDDGAEGDKKRPKLPTVVIVGRPNVGKSALFNRLSGRQAALVADIPGVTRDRLYAEVTSERLDFVLVDTGGLFSESDFKGDMNPEVLRSKMTKQVGQALDEAVALVFVVDGQEGVTYSDTEVSRSKANAPKSECACVAFSFVILTCGAFLSRHAPAL